MTFDEAKDVRIPFGQKYKGQTIGQIAKTDKGLDFLMWASRAWNDWERPPHDILKALAVFLSNEKIAARCNQINADKQFAAKQWR